MADTMPNNDDKRQHLDHDRDSNPVPEPRWMGAVKLAVWIMTVLLVVGIGLLLYGLAGGVDRPLNARAGLQDFTYPRGMALVAAQVTSSGLMQLRFTGRDDNPNGMLDEIVVVDVATQQIISQTRLVPGDGYGFADRP